MHEQCCSDAASNTSGTTAKNKRRTSICEEQPPQPPQQQQQLVELETTTSHTNQHRPKRRHIVEAQRDALEPNASPLSTNSGTSASATAKVAGSQDLAEAAEVIQHVWRRQVLRGPVNKWQAANVTYEHLKRLTFEEATQLIKSPTVVQGSDNLVQVLLRTSHSLGNEDADGMRLKMPGRVFVAGFLFAAHPQLLVTGNSHLDTMVESAAVTMTQTYSQFVTTFNSHHKGWYQILLTSVASLRAFYSALDSWKRSDAEKLLSTMERHYLELDRLWQSVQRRTLGEGDEVWRAGIQQQREDLLSKIQTLGSSDAVSSLMQKQRELRLTYSDPQPSQTPSLAPPEEKQHSSTEHRMIPSPVINGVRTMHVSSHQGFAAAEADDQSKQHDNASSAVNVSADKHGVTTISDGARSDVARIPPPSSVTLAKAAADPVSQDVDRVLGNFALTATGALQDAKLAHELVLDPELRLEPAATNTLVGTVQQAVTRAFFDHMKQDIALGNRNQVVNILTQLRLDMRTLVSPGSQQRIALDRELEPDWMAAQLINGALDVHGKFKLILQTVRGVCAPIRDQNIDELQSELEAVDFGALAGVPKAAVDSHSAASSGAAKTSIDQLLEITQAIMRLIRSVRLDALNHQLDTVVRPWLYVHAAEYEREKMAHLLDAQSQGDAVQTSALASEWIIAAAAREKADQCTLRDAAAQNTLAEPAEGPTKVKHVFYEAFLDMCFAPTALADADMPTTWALDQQRIRQLQNELQVLLSASALCALVKRLNLMAGTPVGDAGLRKYALELLDTLRAEDITMDHVVSSVKQMTAHEGIGHLAQKTLSKEDPVYRAMERQLRKYILTELDKEEEPNGLARRLEGNMQGVLTALTPFSMAVVDKEVACLLLQMSRLCAFNWRVCSQWYIKAMAAWNPH